MTAAENHRRAAWLALAAFTVWTLGDACMKWVQARQVPSSEILLFNPLGSMAVIFFVTLMRGRIGALKPRRKGGLAVLGAGQLISFLCWITALPLLPLANVYVVIFLSPMLVAVFAALFLREKLLWQRGVAIFCGFIGVVIAVDPLSLSLGGAGRAYLAVLGSTVCNVTQMLVVRSMALHESSESVAFYPRLATLTAGLAACAVHGLTALPPLVFAILCLAGAFSAAGWVLIAQAYKNAVASFVAPFHYWQMVMGALLGYLFWGDVPGPWLIAGGAVIVLSGVYVVRNERRMSRVAVRAG